MNGAGVASGSVGVGELHHDPGDDRRVACRALLARMAFLSPAHLSNAAPPDSTSPRGPPSPINWPRSQFRRAYLLA